VEYNEKDDVVAKSSVRREGVDIQVHLVRSELKSLSWAKGLDLWQREWDASSQRRQLYCMHRSIKEEVGRM
jgi:hypothetical protein